ncbi:hypothetical protein [Mycobacterium vicinigordonae]|uniref:Uncharacterized protein n=1 Tax=Mycobacterium vicinigordonae TaxID=1719132 RepID=A0A7D6IAC0_9MYCO|nr:hypothetical protein [Mycobacterium vicinigordonae]QLL08637.1 hypothetical protein H0P51_06835 [Mycobacterium vicinigordonae]
MEYVDKALPDRNKRIRAAERSAKRLIEERDTLLHAHYAGAVPLDQLKTEQERISSALANAQRELNNQNADRDVLRKGLDVLGGHVGDGC